VLMFFVLVGRVEQLARATICLRTFCVIADRRGPGDDDRSSALPTRNSAVHRERDSRVQLEGLVLDGA